MAAIKRLVLTAPPSSVQQGTQGQSHVAVWEARVDKPIPADYVLVLAQEITGTLPPVNDDGTRVCEVPNNGDRLLWADGKFQSDIYASGPAGVTAFDAAFAAYDDRYADAGAYALNFQTVPLAGGCDKDWEITVTFRPPEPGMNERPQQVTQLIAAQAPTSAGTIPFSGPIFDNAVERWIEQRPIRIPTVEGYEVTDVTPPYVVAGTKTKMKMPNWEEYPPVEIDAMVDVLVISRNVGNEFYASNLNASFNNTTNSDNVTFGSRTVPKYHAIYEVTRCGRPMTRNNTEYYRAETRIVLLPEPNFMRRQAWGTYYFDGSGQKKKPFDVDGNPIPQVPLTVSGTIATTENAIAYRVFSREKPTSYAQFAY